VTPHLEITSGGAFNDATYTDWATATCPRSFPTSVAVCDNTGKQIVGAPKWTGLLGFNYEQPFASEYSAHFFGSFTYRSKHNLEQLLSEYGEQKGYSLTDFGLGITHGTRNALYELNVIAKNVFDTRYTTSVNDFSNSAPVGYDGIGPRRYVGVVASARF
jgi:iron complex outermembrane receptor protein